MYWYTCDWYVVGMCGCECLVCAFDLLCCVYVCVLLTTHRAVYIKSGMY